VGSILAQRFAEGKPQVEKSFRENKEAADFVDYQSGEDSRRNSVERNFRRAAGGERNSSDRRLRASRSSFLQAAEAAFCF
jgi:hypothetical protein